MINEKILDDEHERVSMQDARKNLSDLVKKVAYGKEVIIVQNHSKDQVAMVPCEMLANTLILSNEDRDLFIEAFENPPPPNVASKKAMARYRKNHT